MFYLFRFSFNLCQELLRRIYKNVSKEERKRPLLNRDLILKSNI